MQHGIAFKWPLLPLILTCSLAQAGGGYVGQHGAAYIGASAGATDSSVGRNNLTDPSVCQAANANCSVDETDQAWSVQGGYHFTPNVAVEAAYVDLGRTADVSSRQVGAYLRGKQDTSGVSVSMVGKVPLGSMVGYGRAGVYRWESESHIEGPGALNKASDKGTDPTVGVGLEVPIGRNLSARAGWDRYYSTGNSSALLQENGASTLETDVNVYSVGFDYHF